MEDTDRWRIADILTICDTSRARADWEIILCKAIPPRSFCIAVGIWTVLWYTPDVIIWTCNRIALRLYRAEQAARRLAGEHEPRD